MAKYGFDDSELQKLFAEAGDAVKKAKVTQPKAEEKPVAEDRSFDNFPAAEIHTDPHGEGQEVAEAPPSVRHEQPPPRPVATTPSLGQIKAVQIIGGTQDVNNFNAMKEDNTIVAIPWKAMQCLALGRVENYQTVAWIYRNVIYFMIDKNITYKGLLAQTAPIMTQNWRNLLTDLTEKTGLTQEKGIQAFQTPGGLIPKYGNMEEFFRYLQTQKQ